MHQQKLSHVPLSNVRLSDGFWRERRRINRETTLPIQHRQCRDTGRLAAWQVNWQEGDPKPHVFWDSDVAKWIEAAAYSLATHPDAALAQKVDEVIDWIADAQEPDGYLNSYFIAVEPEKRWTNLCDLHELYCAGHLMEAAVAYAEATGKDKLLQVLCRYADHIATVFGPGQDQKPGYPGHEEIELALVRLYRATGKQGYLELAAFFINQRGREPHYFNLEAEARGAAPKDPQKYDYAQAHLPVRQQSTAEGHAVRACYLYAGMADVAAETNDAELWAACRRLWRNIAEQRMYIHGGVGSRRFGERFTFDYDLPNEDAYAETCAAIALVFFARRMLQMEVNASYADVIERCLYNGVISGVALDGKSFFYDNFLASAPPTQQFTGQRSPQRQEWFGCACCPPNLARLLGQLPQYIYSVDHEVLYVHLYTPSTAECELAGSGVTIQQEGNYPWEEDLTLTLTPDCPQTFTVALRLPGWCRQPQVRLNGKDLALADRVQKGYLRITREWSAGDRLQLHLPMPVERIEAHPAVREDSGRVALQRGPVLYCFEEVDNGKNLNALRLPPNAAFTSDWQPELLGGVVTISACGQRRCEDNWEGQLYRPYGQTRFREAAIKAVPYFAWANRGCGEMLVWIPCVSCDRRTSAIACGD